MVYVDDNLQNYDENTNLPKRVSDKSTLLKKYDIPLKHLDYDYVERCTNPREIETILHVLRSGEEGHYPDLIKKTELQLQRLKPNSKYLREQTRVIKRTSLDGQELNDINRELSTFVNDMETCSNELNSFKGTALNYTIDVPIRETKSNDVERCTEKNQNLLKRISSTDYSSWDKYDPDTELLKMDIEDERIKERFSNNSKTELKQEKCVKFNDFRTIAEAKYESNREKEKGNEYFKIASYDDALRHYTNSITCHPNVHSYNNRALVYIKSKRYERAIDDCNFAIKLDSCNVKSYTRKAQCLDALKRYKEALDTIEIAIRNEPNNQMAQQLADKLRNAIGLKDSGTKRLTIVEIRDEDNRQIDVKLNEIDACEDRKMERKRTLKPILKNKYKERDVNRTDYRLIPIAGTSKMKQPYYRIINIRDQIEVANFYREILNRPRVYFLNTIDNDDDDCLDIHIKPSSDKRRNVDLIKREETLEENEVKITETKNNNGDVEKDLLDEVVLKLDDVHLNKSARKEVFNVASRMIENDSGGGGEPTKLNEDVDMSVENDLHSPYTFFKTWNSISKDESYAKHADVLRRLNMYRIAEVIGCKLDNNMFTIILNCLYRHFCVANELDKVHSALINLTNVQRFNIIAMLMSRDDRICARNLIKFLKQHGRTLPEDVIKKYE